MKKNDKVDLSVIILSYNTKELLRACLSTVFASLLGDYTMEVIVCDNASDDGSLEMVSKEFPEVIRIQNGKNIGFAAGNNSGIKKSKGRYILLLNSDTEVRETTFFSMISYMDAHHDVGVSTCKVLLPSGDLDPSCHRGFPTPWASLTYLLKLEKLFPTSTIFGQYHQGYKGLETIHEVDCIVGAFFMVRREVIEHVGLLDEDYFMYGEDIDWCYRIKKADWKIMFNPQTSILHRKKQSGRDNILKKRRNVTEVYFHRYNWLFYKKHYKKIYPWWITMMVDDFYTIRIFLLERIGI
ncbi:MAG: glycosyltransferase family 2 protein [Patescibacteria group bacterium]